MLLRHVWISSRFFTSFLFDPISFIRYHVHNDRLDLFGGLEFCFSYFFTSRDDGSFLPLSTREPPRGALSSR
jgi:hypothetical protein